MKVDVHPALYEEAKLENFPPLEVLLNTPDK